MAGDTTTSERQLSLSLRGMDLENPKDGFGILELGDADQMAIPSKNTFTRNLDPYLPVAQMDRASGF